MLTQLMELVYWTNYNKNLKDMVPFNVSFVGDRFAEPEEEEDEELIHDTLLHKTK
jgi:hypothetical protein